jgi:DNA topoisomerase IA
VTSAGNGKERICSFPPPASGCGRSRLRGSEEISLGTEATIPPRCTTAAVVDLLLVESIGEARAVQSHARLAGLTAVVEAVGDLIPDRPAEGQGDGLDVDTLLPLPAEFTHPAAKKRLERIQQLIGSATRVIVATPNSPHGEAVAAQLWPLIPQDRVWRTSFEEITADGLTAALHRSRPAFDGNLANSAVARHVVDRLAAWHATDTVFKKLKGFLGGAPSRLQAAALQLVLERCRENKSLSTPPSSWGVRGRFRKTSGEELLAVLVDDDGIPRDFATRAAAESAKASPSAAVRSITTKRASQRPRPPLGTTSWLQLAQRALGLSIYDATRTAQALFEAGKITYPLTDAVRISAAATSWARSEIKRRFGQEYVPPSPLQHVQQVGDDDGHEAIRPTIPADADDLAKRAHLPLHQDAYSLIEARLLASQAAARVVDVTHLQIVTADHSQFQAHGQREIFPGWKKMLAPDIAEENTDQRSTGPVQRSVERDLKPVTLASLVEGDALELVALEVFPRRTQIRPLFTQAALVAELRRLGIGRAHTYHSIVPSLLSRRWVTEESPQTSTSRAGEKSLGLLIPTASGETVTTFFGQAFPSLVDGKLAAQLETMLDDVRAGRATRDSTTRQWWTRFALELTRARSLPVEQVRKDLGACPRCATAGRRGRLRLLKGISKKTNKPYEFATCDLDTRDEEVCGNTAPTHDGELLELLACPQCKRAMRPVHRKDGGQSWVCPSEHWFMATRDWRLVKSPSCQICRQPLVHREKTLAKGEFFWACFADKLFLPSDVFGKVGRPKTAPGPEKRPGQPRRPTSRQF